MLEITRRRDGEEQEDEEEVVFTEKNDDGVGDDDKGGVRLCMNQTRRCRRNDSEKTKLPVT